MRWLALLVGIFSCHALSQEANETRELIGHVGGRAALMNL